MSTNLRLRPEAAAALRKESARTGVSQQEILRKAVDEHLGLAPTNQLAALPEWVKPPTHPYRRANKRIVPPPGTTFSTILSELREERL